MITKFINTLRSSKLPLAFYSIPSFFILCYRTRLCSYDINITYPQTSPLPSIPLVLPTSREIPYYSGSNKMSKRQVLEAIQKRSTERTVELVRDADLGKREVPNFEIEREAWKAERLHGDLAGVLDPWVSPHFS